MSREVCHFEDFELDPNAYRLSHNGDIVRLERIPLELLCFLVERRGQLVTREEILERVWGKGVFIDSENAINTAVRKIRRALRDDAESPRFIITIPGKGYRFVAPVPNGELTANGKNEQQINGKSAESAVPTAVSMENQPGRNKYLLIGLLSVVGLALIASAMIAVPHLLPRASQPSASRTSAELAAPRLPNKPSIAVLPFINLSGDREQEYFSDGITDDLITDLARLPGLFVIARDSTFTYKGKAAKLQDVSKQLGVKYVLAGTVRRAAGRMRVTVQLADATTGVELWAERYDRPLRDIFALQDEIVRRIETTLNLEIALSQQGVVIPRSTENLEAYDDVLRGTEYLLAYTKAGNGKARVMFENAIALDPNYAYAYASLAEGYFLGWALGFNPNSDALERALPVAQQAIALDDSLAAAHSILALIYIHNGQNAHMYERNWQNDQAPSEAQRGIVLDPNSAFGYAALADVLNLQAKHTEALSAAEKAMRLDPRNSVTYMMAQGQAYTGLERWQEATSAIKGFLGRYPDHLWAHAWLAINYFNLRDRDRARAEAAQVERVAALSPSAVSYSGLAIALVAIGKPAESLAAAVKGMRLDPQNPFILAVQGWAYSELGLWEQGRSVSKRYLDLYPNDVGAHASLAGAYSSLGQMDAARREAAQVERAVALDPDSAYGYRYLAWTLNEIGRPAEALVAAENSMRLYPSSGAIPPYSLCEQGRAYTQLGRWENAVHALNACLTRHPNDIRSHAALAVDYIQLGQSDAARAEVMEILRLNPQFSLKMAVESEFPAQRERAADLRRAGLK